MQGVRHPLPAERPVEEPPDAVAPAPFAVTRPSPQSLPLVVSSPHSGSYCPRAFLADSRLEWDALRQSEDFYVDELAAEAPALGAPLLKALYSRAYVDLNREPYELDPAMFAETLPEHVNSRSERVGLGLGTIAREIARGQPIYRRKLSFAEAHARIEAIHRPYHDALAALIGETRRAFGYAVLVDCHSMPDSVFAARSRPARPDFVIGDRHGASASLALVARAELALRGMGYRVALNAPYAGGYITEFYGRPGQGAHALQIEINRSLYMNETTRERHAGADRLKRDLGALFAELARVRI